MSHSAVSTLASLVLLAGFAFWSWGSPADHPSADLLATWLAGSFLAAGEAGQVYADSAASFQMVPPPAWAPLMQACAPLAIRAVSSTWS